MHLVNRVNLPLSPSAWDDNLPTELYLLYFDRCYLIDILIWFEWKNMHVYKNVIFSLFSGSEKWCPSANSQILDALFQILAKSGCSPIWQLGKSALPKNHPPPPIIISELSLKFKINTIMLSKYTVNHTWWIIVFYPVMHAGLCLALYILYGESRVICTLTS